MLKLEACLFSALNCRVFAGLSGMTPKRKEYSYPRELVRSRSRGELLKQFRAQQEVTQCVPLEEEEEEEKPIDQVLLKNRFDCSLYVLAPLKSAHKAVLDVAKNPSLK